MSTNDLAPFIAQTPVFFLTAPLDTPFPSIKMLEQLFLRSVRKNPRQAAKLIQYQMKRVSAAPLLVVLLHVFAPTDVKATIYTILVSGAIASGTDYSGVFGFLPNTNLANKNYTITITFDDTAGAQQESCSNSGDGFENCASSIYGGLLYGSNSSAPGVAVLAIEGGSTPYTFGGSGNTYLSLAQVSVPNAGYSAEITVYDGLDGVDASDQVNVVVSGSSSPQMNFDWRSAFSQVLDGVSVSSEAVFGISSESSNAIGVLGISSISESGMSCAGTPNLTIDTSSAGQQPNILLAADYTNADVNIKNAITWFPVYLSYLIPSASQDPSSVIVTDLTGSGSFTYISSGDNGNDQVTGTVCGTGSAPLPIYDYNAYLDSNKTVVYNIHQSQVDDNTFTSPANIDITKFLAGVHPGPSFLRNFYFVNTSVSGVNSGFQDVDGDQKYTADGDGPAYCSNGATDCVPENTSAKPLMSFSDALLEISSIYGINPQLLLVKLQVEKSLNSFSTLSDVLEGRIPPYKTSYKTLNHAVGCLGVNTFFEQLECGAKAFIDNYNKTPSEPYFFPVDSDNVSGSIQYASTNTANCIDGSTTPGCVLVGFVMGDAATTAQFNYTPFVQTTTGTNSGGVRAFETIWYKYSSHNWYQQ